MLSLPRCIFQALLAGLVVFSVLTGCSKNDAVPSWASNEGTQHVTLLSPKAPSLIPALLIEQQKDAEVKLKVEMWDTVEQLLARVQKNDVQFFATPLNVGANMYARGLPLQLLHVNTWGSMYLVSLDPEVHNLSDLANKTVYIPGQSGPPDILTRFLLEKEGLEGRVTLAYGVIPDIMQQLAAGTIRYAVLPEPVLSGLRVKLNGRLTEVVDYQQIWRDSFGEDLPQTGIFVNREWARTHQEEVERFQRQYRDALYETVKQPKTAVNLSTEAFGIPEVVLLQAMPHISLTFKDAVEARSEVERYFNILLQTVPDSIGGV
ncbi:ABC transporter substrate-binding protein [Aneurinibacillus migulanus]|uniref:ABC transporter substrate-binding protein n=1 Tax=Aneurinibacillus migulanus TaxID=47500 RepID=UPI00209C6ECF|nr:ABC transporter substrate-binding protein [Aneurinibacillus migulanus]MCP1359308.1 ABC transporter substrate-binding protein [Aneurinibacillus migulanus]